MITSAILILALCVYYVGEHIVEVLDSIQESNEELINLLRKED